MSELLKAAVGHQTAGRLEEAGQLYRRILSDVPQFADGLNLLGLCYCQTKRFLIARDLFGRAVVIDGACGAYQVNLGSALLDLGRVDDSIDAFRRVLGLQANFAEAWYNLGNALKAAARYESAATAYQGAIVLKPDYQLAYNNLAVVLKSQGRLVAAASVCARTVLANPDFAEGHGNLGLILNGLGRLQNALVSLRGSLTLLPGSAEVLANLGNTLDALGMPQEAARIYQRAACLRPDDVAAHLKLGDTLRRQGQCEGAIVAYDAGLRAAPNDAELHNRRGLVLFDLRRYDEAVTSFLKALALRTDFGIVHHSLGIAFKELGQLGKAILCCRTAIVWLPDLAETYNDLANACSQDGSFKEVGALYKRSIRLMGSFSGSLYNFATFLRKQMRPNDAALAASMAIALDPDMAVAINELANVFHLQGNAEAAVLLYERAILVNPDNHLFRANVAHTLFCLGRLPEAWQAYEFRAMRSEPTGLPRWDGRPAPGKALLLAWEQGLADQLLAAGMAMEAARRVGAVVLECDTRLVSLFSRSFPDITIVPLTVPLHPLAASADCWLPLLSLGQHFRANLADFPSHHGYLQPDPVRLAQWRDWLATLGPGIKIGLSWRSKSKEVALGVPSLERLKPIFDIPGLTFVNLQYGEAEDEIEHFRRRTGHLIHIPEGLDVTDDIDGVSALIGALDGVTGLSSAASILAGAIGTPTLMYMFYPGFNENRMFDQDFMPWLPAAEIITYPYDQDLDLLVDKYAVHLAKWALGTASVRGA